MTTRKLFYQGKEQNILWKYYFLPNTWLITILKYLNLPWADNLEITSSYHLISNWIWQFFFIFIFTSGTWSWSYWIDWPSRRTRARCASTLRPAPCSSRVSTRGSAKPAPSNWRPAPCAGQLFRQSRSYRRTRK